MSININSEASCRKAYLNYHCYGNSMGISTKEMTEIKAVWGDKLRSWQKTVAQDENVYEFDDDQFEDSRAKGKQTAQDATGYKGKKGWQITRTGGDVANSSNSFSGAAVAVGAKGTSEVAKKVAENAVKKAGEKALKNAIKKGGEEVVINAGKEAIREAAKNAAKEVAEESGKTIGKKALEEAGEKAVTEATEEAIKKAGEESIKRTGEEASKVTAQSSAQSIGCIVACAVGLATGLAYMAKRPNIEQKKACDEMQTQLTNAQGALNSTQSHMKSMSEEMITLSDEANSVNEDANSNIEDKKSDYDLYMQLYNSLKAKIDSGKPLTEAEKAMFKEVVGYLSSTGAEISALSDEAGETVQDIYDDMGTYQEGYDYAAENIGEIEGMSDYAANIDKSTQTMCYIEAGAQGLNAASSGIASYRALALANSGSWAFGATALAYVAAAAGAAGAALSGLGAKEQYEWAGQVGKEIDIRKETQDLNANTLDVYNEEIDSYGGMMDGVNDLELDIPDDVSAPQDTSLPNSNPANGTPKETDKKKKEDT